MATTWATEGRIQNPAAGTILADTGPVDGISNHSPQALISSTAIAQILLQHRDVTNTITLSEQILVCPANSTVNFGVQATIQGVQAGERFRLVLNAALTGGNQCQGSLFT